MNIVQLGVINSKTYTTMTPTRHAINKWQKDNKWQKNNKWQKAVANTAPNGLHKGIGSQHTTV